MLLVGLEFGQGVKIVHTDLGDEVEVFERV